MSVVIIGGHDRMVRKYKDICMKHNYKAKVFTQMCTGLSKNFGSVAVGFFHFCNELQHNDSRTLKYIFAEYLGANVTMETFQGNMRLCQSEFYEFRCLTGLQRCAKFRVYLAGCYQQPGRIDGNSGKTQRMRKGR